MRFFLIFFSLFCVPFAIADNLDSIIKPRLIDDEFYSETFTLFADMDNGQYLYAQIGVSNIGPGDQNGLCRIMIFRPGENSINESVLLKNSQWRYADNPFTTLTVGLCSLSLDEDNRLNFSGNIKDTAVQISLDNKVQTNITPFNKIKTNEGQYFSEVLIPWSSAKASSKNNKNKGELLKGFGYADHSVSTFLPADLATQWIRFRGINEIDSHLLLVRYPSEKNQPEGWIWKQNGVPVTISQITKTFAQMPAINVVTSDNNSAKYAINAEQLIYRQAPLEEKGLIGKVISQLMGNPVTYTYRASMTTHSGKTIKGILEVSVANE